MAVVLFLAGVGGVLAAGGAILLREIVRRLGRRPPARRRAYIWARRILGPLAGLVVVCMAYAYFVEPYWLEVTHVRIVTDELPAAARPIRIVHISDLHCDPKVRLEEKLPDIVRELKPDLICFTGDAVNSMDALGNFRLCMRRLAEIAPVYAVLGNWDVWTQAQWHSEGMLLDLPGVRLLDGQAEKVAIAGAELWVAGAAPGRSGKLDQALRAAPDGAYTVLLYHYPDEIYRAAERGVDLYLAGHTHGGQVALPFYGALVTLSQFGKRFEAGHYRVRGTDLYVSRGIGMEGQHAPRMRFCARPEVTLIELVPAK